MPEKWQQWYPHIIDPWQGSGDVQGLSDLGYRAVHNVLMELWKQSDCALATDDATLGRASRTFKRWPKCKSEVLRYFEDRTPDGKLTHRILLREFRKAQEIYSERRQRAAHAAQSRRKHQAINIDSNNYFNSESSSDQCDDTLTNTKTGTGTEVTKENAQPRFAIPPWIERKTWDGYEEMRRRMRKPMTDHARELAVERLAAMAEKGHNPTDIINSTILNGWTGFFEPKGESNGTHQQRDQPNQPAAVERQRIAHANIREAFERRYGHGAVGLNGGNSGPLSESNTASGDAGYVPGGMGTADAPLWPDDVPGCVIEGNPAEPILS